MVDVGQCNFVLANVKNLKPERVFSKPNLNYKLKYKQDIEDHDNSHTLHTLKNV
jgi:hypothetical protein